MKINIKANLRTNVNNLTYYQQFCYFCIHNLRNNCMKEEISNLNWWRKVSYNIWIRMNNKYALKKRLWILYVCMYMWHICDICIYDILYGNWLVVEKRESFVIDSSWIYIYIYCFLIENAKKMFVFLNILFGYIFIKARVFRIGREGSLYKLCLYVILQNFLIKYYKIESWLTY